MSQSGKKHQGSPQRSVQTGTVNGRQPNVVGALQQTQGGKLTEFGYVDLHAKLQAENDELRAQVVALALEMQSLRDNRYR
jgi:hypothetical protein